MLTNRALRAGSPADERPVRLSRIPADLVDRMLKVGRRKAKALSVDRLDYVLLGQATLPPEPPDYSLRRRPAFAMYYRGRGDATGYFQTDLTGRSLLTFHAP
jgi:hypothetical protein